MYIVHDMYLYTCIPVHCHAYTCTCIPVYLYTVMHIHVPVYLYTCTLSCIYMYLYTCTCSFACDIERCPVTHSQEQPDQYDEQRGLYLYTCTLSCIYMYLYTCIPVHCHAYTCTCIPVHVVLHVTLNAAPSHTLRNNLINMMSNAIFKHLTNLTQEAPVAIATYIMSLPTPLTNLTLDISIILGGILYPYATSFLLPVSSCTPSPSLLPLTHSLTHSLTLTHTLTLSLTHSLTHSITHSLTPSLHPRYTWLLWSRINQRNTSS